MNGCEPNHPKRRGKLGGTWHDRDSKPKEVKSDWVLVNPETGKVRAFHDDRAALVSMQRAMGGEIRRGR